MKRLALGVFFTALSAVGLAQTVATPATPKPAGMAAAAEDSPARSQVPAAAGPDAPTTSIVRIMGESEPGTPYALTYLRLVLAGELLETARETRAAGAKQQIVIPPNLIAQCTSEPGGKLSFRLYATFGGVGDTAFYPELRKAPGQLFLPPIRTALVTMSFLGYTRVKPVQRRWQLMDEPAGAMRYLAPGLNSGNMEDVSFYLRYLVSLPTLRLGYAGQTAEFKTAALLDQTRREPLCKASLL